MWSVCKKEISQFFSSLTGYIAVVLFLLLNGLFLFVFPDNILDSGYATLQPYFDLAPWILLFLIPAITMRSFADEFKAGTYELLQTSPVGYTRLISGKYLGSLIIVVFALLPTLLYIPAIQALSEGGSGLDMGATYGAFIGLLMLAAVFTAIGVACSSFTSNSVAAFLISGFTCFVLYNGFNALSRIPVFAGSADYYIELLGIDFHYNSISRGVIDLRDIIYFLSIIFLAGCITYRNLLKR